MPGRIYVGVHGPGLGSIQTAQVRTFATLAQSVRDLPADEQDPWWTLLVFSSWSVLIRSSGLTTWSEAQPFRVEVGYAYVR